jgi:regulator of extracellular matrix RemA (YlzA/DUF370 family)
MFIDVGYNNYVSLEKIITIAKSDSAPIKRMWREAKEAGGFIDLTQGKKTRSILICKNDGKISIIGTSLQTQTIVSSIRKQEEENAKIKYEVEKVFVAGEGSSDIIE